LFCFDIKLKLIRIVRKVLSKFLNSIDLNVAQHPFELISFNYEMKTNYEIKTNHEMLNFADLYEFFF